MNFLCGAAREIITPPVGTLLYGYQPDLASTSVHDDLTATAIAFSSGTDTALLVSVTVGDIQTELDRALRAEMASACGVPADRIILAATHTHCGPNVSGVAGWGEIDRPYIDTILRPALIRAAQAAVDAMIPAELAVTHGESRVGINRRQQLRDGRVQLGQNPWGGFDPTMTVISVRAQDGGHGIVHLIHYGCHGTACGRSTEITRDWPGTMIDRVEAQTGTLTAFFNGAIGDVGPRLTNGSTTGNIRHVEELGGVAAFDAMRILNLPKTYAVPELRLHTGTVRLPYQPHPPLEEVRRALAQIGHPDALINHARLRYTYLKSVESLLLRGESTPDALTYPVTLVTVGGVALIPIPFEFFAEISMRLRADSPVPYTLGLSCANGYRAYLPTQDQLCRGGYEVAVFRYASPYRLADDTDQHLINEIFRILDA